MTVEIRWDTVFTHTRDVVTRRIAGELLLVPIRRHVKDLQQLFALNEVAAEVYDLLDGNRTLGEIRDILLDEYEVDRATLEADLRAHVAHLVEVKAITSLGADRAATE